MHNHDYSVNCTISWDDWTCQNRSDLCNDPPTLSPTANPIITPNPTSPTVPPTSLPTEPTLEPTIQPTQPTITPTDSTASPHQLLTLQQNLLIRQQ